MCIRDRTAIDHIIARGQVDFPAILAVLKQIAIAIAVTALAQWIMNICNNKMTYQDVYKRQVEGQFSDGIKKDFTPADVRYTAKGDHIYATALKCSPEGSYLFPAPVSYTHLDVYKRQP